MTWKDQKFQRELKKIPILEKMLEEKTRELFFSYEQSHKAFLFFSEMFDSLSEPVVVTNRDLKIIKFNKKFENSVEKSPEEIEENNFNSFLAKKITLNEESTNQINLLKSKSSKIPIQITGKEFLNPEGKNLFVFLIHNIKEFQEKEEKSRQDQEILEKKIKERTQSLEKALGIEKILRADLENTKQNLEKLVEERTQSYKETADRLRHEINEKEELQDELVKSARLAGMTEKTISVLHNIGNILTALNMQLSSGLEIQKLEKVSEILSKVPSKISELKADQLSDILKNLQKELQEIITSITTNMNQSKEKLSLMGDIISVQQSAVSNGLSIKNHVNLKKLIAEVLSIQKERTQEHQIEIDLKLEEISLNIDKFGFLQVLTNLFINSVEAIEERRKKEKNRKGHILIKSSTTKNHVLISFKDNGIGIEKDEILDIFKFGVSSKGRSSGFGLHSCANFIKSYDGNIQVKSEGHLKGSEFLIELPKVS